MTVPNALPAEDPISTARSEEHTSELQSQSNLVCRLLLEKKKHILIDSPSRLRASLPCQEYSAATEQTFASSHDIHAHTDFTITATAPVAHACTLICATHT